MTNLSAYFLVGPTAVGKTRIAHEIARQQDMDIVSADSMLIYQGMDIGTAKPSTTERDEIRYYAIDVLSPTETFNVSDYRRCALDALREVEANGRQAIVVGGTGLYIKSLTHGLHDRAAPDPEHRASLEALLARDGVEALRQKLVDVDPAALETLKDPDNPRRVIRAIEMTASGSRPTSSAWAEPGPAICGVTMPRDALRTRIRQRVRNMYTAGLEQEVAGLIASATLGQTAEQAIGYAEMIDLIRCRCTEEEAIERTVTRTNRLAKRQDTWFRNQANVQWINVDPGGDLVEAIQAVKEHWNEHGRTAIKD